MSTLMIDAATHTTRLSNGLTVAIKEARQSQSAVVYGFLRTGASLEPAEKTGLALFASSLLGRGNRRRSAAEIQQQVDSMAASMSITAGREVTVFKARCLSEDVWLMLELLSDSLLAPAFPPREVEQARRRMLYLARRMANDPASLAELKLRRALYGARHPYGRSVRPTAQTIARLERDDLVRFHQETYHPCGGMVVVVGNVPARKAQSKIEELLEGWHSPPPPMKIDSPVREGLPGSVLAWSALGADPRASVLAGMIGPQRGDSDFLAARLCNAILGKIGLQGRIGRCLRARGLAYECGSRLGGGFGSAPWIIHASIRPESVPAAASLIKEEVCRLREELVDGEELAIAKAYLIGAWHLGLAEHAGLAAALAELHFSHLCDDDLTAYPARIDRISREEVRAVARRYLADPVAIDVRDTPTPEKESL